MEVANLNHSKKCFLDWQIIALWFISLIILAFSFYHQYFEKFEPCNLCHLQRFVYLLICTIAPFGLIRRIYVPIKTALNFIFFLGFCLASYHALVQIGWLADRCIVTQKIENMTDFMQMLEHPKTHCAIIGWKLFGLSASIYNSIFSLCALISLNFHYLKRFLYV